MATNYRLKVSRGDDVFEAEGDKKFVVDMISRYADEGKHPLPASVSRSNGEVNGKSMSVSEFIRQTGLKKHVDRVLAFGYYLEKQAGQEQFSVADVNKCYYESKLENSNTSMMISQNVKRGFIMAAKGNGEKKAGYTLTKSGEDFVSTKLHAEAV